MNTSTPKHKLTDEQYQNLKKLYIWLNRSEDLPSKLSQDKGYYNTMIKVVMKHCEYGDFFKKGINEVVKEYNKINGH